MLRVNMNENVTVHKAPERQAAVQGQLSTGRVVGQTPATAWIPGQMEGASSTSWRTILPHSEAVHSRAVKRPAGFPTEEVSAKRPKGPETTTQPWQFKDQVDDAIRQLCDERDRNKPDNFSFCLMIVDTCRMLEQNLVEIKAHLMPNDYNTCHRRMIFEMSKLYDKYIRKALVFFHNQITIGHDWVYTKGLDKITKYFNKLGVKSVSTASNEALLKEIWELHLGNELEYLKYLKDSPDGHCVAEQTITNIRWLTSDHSPTCYLDLISAQDLHGIRARTDRLYHEIGNSVNCSDAGKKRENVPHMANNKEMEKRKRHSLLFGQFKKLRTQITRTSGDSEIHRGRNRICHLQELFELYETCDKLFDHPCTPLFVQLNSLITKITNELRVKLEKGAYDGDQTLKDEVSSLLSDPKTERCLNRKHKNPYLGDIQSQNAVIPVVRESVIIMHTQQNEFMDDIFTLLNVKTRDKDIMALGQLKQFLDHHEKLKKYQLDDLKKNLDPVRRILFARLYFPILADYKNLPHNTLESAIQAGAIMYCHKDKVIELTPYVAYVTSTPNGARAWQCAACFVWFNDLRNLCCQTSFTEKDVDNLLDLKDAAPDLPSYIVGDSLVMVLTRLFPFMLQTSPDTALIKKVTKLSEWIYYLGRESRHNHGISQELYEYNEEWREKYIGKAGEGDTTPSSTSAARMPSSVHPGTLSVLSSETFDCHSRMGRQDVPHTGQFSTPCPGVPTPTPGGASWRPESSIPCRTPVAQSVAGSSPFPPPWLINRPFLPRIPAPACNRADFRRPPVCGQIRPRWRQAESQQQYENPDDRPCI